MSETKKSRMTQMSSFDNFYIFYKVIMTFTYFYIVMINFAYFEN